jgi:D-2-hydroxyacid dehydrogenase (NADP+)
VLAPGKSVTVLIADPRAADYRRRLRERFGNVQFCAATDRAALNEGIAAADVLVSFATELDAQMLERAVKLRWIQLLSTGTDQITPLLGGRRDILLTSARGVHGAPVSELALLFMLALARRFPSLLRNQAERRWIRHDGTLLEGKTVGIAGIGVIGAQIAKRAQGFGMRTIAFGSAPRPVQHVDEFYSYGELALLAPALDMLVIATPLRPSTRGMFDARIFRAMKASAFVINVGRGAVVNEADLIAALQEKRIAGAAIDAFAQEPLSPTSVFWSLENVIVTPHVGGLHDGYVAHMMGLLETNLEAFLAGRTEQMLNRVEVERDDAL